MNSRIKKAFAVMTLSTAVALMGSTAAHAEPAPLPGGSGTSGSMVFDTCSSCSELLIEIDKSDKGVEALLDGIGAQYPDHNVMVIQQETYDGPDNLTDVAWKGSTDIGTNTFDIWVFKTGSFTNDGDLGMNNWGWVGKNWVQSEDKHTVTFNAP